MSSQYWNQYPPAKPTSAMNGPGQHASTNINFDSRVNINRTPSPTPSEEKELQTGAIDFKAMMNWHFWFRREWLWYYVLIVIITTLTALMTIYHDQIVNWLTPFTQWVHDLKFGWLIPIGILFVISFPPLFGHEIVAVLCGLVWGLWIGFGIVCAGTFIGEIGNFYAFKYCCRARGDKLEKTKLSYACLAKCVREGGFKIALIARLSAIPGHFTTAIFSTCGMNIFIFCIAAALSLPKQFVTVYLGVIFGQAGTESTKQKAISDSVVAVTVLITVVACWYILRKMNEAKPAVIYERRKARQAKVNNGVYSTPNLSSSDVFDPNVSDSNIPLTANKGQYGYGAGQGRPYPFGAPYQSSSAGNIIYAPKPQHRYSPENHYNEDTPEDVAGVGHVAPGGTSNPSYNYTPTRQTSDEVGFDVAGPSGVGSAVPSPRIPPGVSNVPRTQSPEIISSSSQPISSHPSSYPSQPQLSSYQPPATHYPTSAPMSPNSNPYTPQSLSYQPPPHLQTPTQAQFVSYNPPGGSGTHSPVVASTPTQMQYEYTPSSPHTYTLPTATQTQTQYAPPQTHGYTSPYTSAAHAYEPSDGTYHTAMASSDSLGPGVGIPSSNPNAGYHPSPRDPPPGYAL